MGKKFFPTKKVIYFLISRLFIIISVQSGNFLKFKNPIPYVLQSGLVHKFSRGNFTFMYTGETYRHLSTRTADYKGIPITTVQTFLNPLNSSKRDYALQ